MGQSESRSLKGPGTGARKVPDPGLYLRVEEPEEGPHRTEVYNVACGICGNVLNDARVLCTSRHTYCLACIKGVRRVGWLRPSIACPRCSELIPAANLADLPRPDRRLCDILETTLARPSTDPPAAQASDRKWGLSDWLAFICVAALVLLLALQQDDEEEKETQDRRRRGGDAVRKKPTNGK